MGLKGEWRYDLSKPFYSLEKAKSYIDELKKGKGKYE